MNATALVADGNADSVSADPQTKSVHRLRQDLCKSNGINFIILGAVSARILRSG